MISVVPVERLDPRGRSTVCGWESVLDLSLSTVTSSCSPLTSAYPPLSSAYSPLTSACSPLTSACSPLTSAMSAVTVNHLSQTEESLGFGAFCLPALGLFGTGQTQAAAGLEFLSCLQGQSRACPLELQLSKVLRGKGLVRHSQSSGDTWAPALAVPSYGSIESLPRWLHGSTSPSKITFGCYLALHVVQC